MLLGADGWQVDAHHIPYPLGSPPPSGRNSPAPLPSLSPVLPCSSRPVLPVVGGLPAAGTDPRPANPYGLYGVQVGDQRPGVEDGDAAPDARGVAPVYTPRVYRCSVFNLGAPPPGCLDLMPRFQVQTCGVWNWSRCRLVRHRRIVQYNYENVLPSECQSDDRVLLSQVCLRDLMSCHFLQ